jgi:predicted AAA+ superfamily ATPase
MYKRLLQAPLNSNRSFFLFGPRGTGKTHWVKTALPSALYIDLLESTLYIELTANPQRIEALIPPGFSDWIIIDEVQKIPKILDEVHRLIETFHYKFVLTGSSARSLRKKGVNLLAGRALTFHMHPLTVQEMGPDFSLHRALLFGMLPEVSSLTSPEPYLSSYVQTYLREEVLQEGLTRNLSAFTRFLETASFSQGSLLNVSEIARECACNRKVVENYFQILEDLLIASKVPVFKKRAARSLSTHPKFYFFDTGIFRTLRPKGPFDRTEEIDGAALETLFFQEIRALNDYLSLSYEIFYWRTATGQEVDFVLYGPKGLLAFEIKRSRSLSPHDFKGLEAFTEDYPEVKPYILYGGSKKEYRGTICALPYEAALHELPQIIMNS